MKYFREYVVKFLRFVFILFERQRETEMFLLLAYCPKAAIARAESGPSQGPVTQPMSPMWVTGTQAIICCLQVGVLAES